MNEPHDPHASTDTAANAATVADGTEPTATTVQSLDDLFSAIDACVATEQPYLFYAKVGADFVPDKDNPAHKGMVPTMARALVATVGIGKVIPGLVDALVWSWMPDGAVESAMIEAYASAHLNKSAWKLRQGYPNAWGQMPLGIVRVHDDHVVAMLGFLRPWFQRNNLPMIYNQIVPGDPKGKMAWDKDSEPQLQTLHPVLTESIAQYKDRVMTEAPVAPRLRVE